MENVGSDTEVWTCRVWVYPLGLPSVAKEQKPVISIWLVRPKSSAALHSILKSFQRVLRETIPSKKSRIRTGRGHWAEHKDVITLNSYLEWICFVQEEASKHLDLAKVRARLWVFVIKNVHREGLPPTDTDPGQKSQALGIEPGLWSRDCYWPEWWWCRGQKR